MQILGPALVNVGRGVSIVRGDIGPEGSGVEDD